MDPMRKEADIVLIPKLSSSTSEIKLSIVKTQPDNTAFVNIKLRDVRVKMRFKWDMSDWRPCTLAVLTWLSTGLVSGKEVSVRVKAMTPQTHRHQKVVRHPKSDPTRPPMLGAATTVNDRRPLRTAVIHTISERSSK